MVINTITEAKAQLSALVDRAARGEEIVISKAGKAMAVLVPYSKASTARVPGRLRGKIRIAADFDSLPGDIAERFGAIDE